jgi:acyl-CoA reductase-like NAD-dependent aldehyde dehydrogenase
MQSSGFSTINPSTGEQIETFSFYNSSEIEEVLVRAEKSFQSYRKLPVHQRAQLLSHLAETLRKNKTWLAKVITTEMGKILPEAEAEIEKCAAEADWYAEHGPQMLADAPAPTGRVNAYVSYLPLGPILAIMPWNFPIWQLTRMALPTMLAGNVVLVKHSHNTQRSSLEFERVILEAGFPTEHGLRDQFSAERVEIAPGINRTVHSSGRRSRRNLSIHCLIGVRIVPVGSITCWSALSNGYNSSNCRTLPLAPQRR